ncbi:MAG: hypothetical protein M3R63_07060 [Actinomycetota bacterium]|nr:hypothetical protein [Actinomycetota bacterium]
MTTASRHRVRAAVLTGAAALAVLSTGACNDESPAQIPGNQQDDGGDNGDDGDGGEDDDGGGY